MPPKVGNEILRKLQPKLRMIANGDTTVNVVRAERCAALSVVKPDLLKKVPPLRGKAAAGVTRKEMKKKLKAPRLKAITPDVLTNVFVYLDDARAEDPPWHDRPTSRSGRIMQVQTKLNDVPKLASAPQVAFVEIAEALKAPMPALAELRPKAPSTDLRRFQGAGKHKYGQDVLIGIVDVQGFDFAHSDFLDGKGGTRFVRIWDQGGSERESPAGSQFSYGAEFHREHLNAALKAAPWPGTARNRHRKAITAGRRVARHARGQHRGRQPRRLPKRRHRWCADLTAAVGRGPQALLLRLQQAGRCRGLPAAAWRRTQQAGCHQRQPGDQRARARRERGGHTLDRRRADDLRASGSRRRGQLRPGARRVRK